MIYPIKVKGTIPLILTAFLVLGLSSQASAVPMLDPCGPPAAPAGTCTVTGPHNGNDSEAALLTILGVPVTEIFKSDPPGSDGNGVTVTVDGDMLSGTWASPGKAIDYVVAKAGPNFLIQNYVDASNGPAFNGLWSTFGLTVGQQNNQPDISHVTFYNQTAPVPIPGAILLFGSGLIGLIGIARRKGFIQTN
ncbi:MAG TPA: hypothetical protein PKK23_09020 [Nitrospirales bacterium]|nr:hypothetical protein [Nitrospiraceae bacterium]HNP29171.1 hypothetical protein [Nitrospirales bacterium]